ncbi:MAG TPA: ATP-binding protein [Streptosporangiaceae bacterium]|nr:ATP-binding protein [Streptosporangiaceae bacterium]
MYEPASRQQATPPLRWSRTFPAQPDQVRHARRFLAQVLDGCPAADDAIVCLSELVTNALLHSVSSRPGGTFRVRATLWAGLLRVEVEDDGPWEPGISHDSHGGRGLVIVDALARNWGITENGQASRTIWFELRCWTTAINGHRLRHLRRQHGLTQAELAAKAGMSPATVARLERQPCASCRGRTLTRLAAALGEQAVTLGPASHPDGRTPY